MNIQVIMCYMLGQYLPYTFTAPLLDTTDPASLLTLHLYMYCPMAIVVLVVYNTLLLLLLTVIQLLPELLSQEYFSVPIPQPLHIRVVLFPSGTILSVGWFEINGGSI